MDPNNFVAPSGGGYVVFRDGKQIGAYPTKQQAEQAFNAYQSGLPAPSAGVDDAAIIQWANSLGRPDLVDWARQFVAANGTLPTSLSQVPQGGGGGGYPGSAGGYGFDVAGGYGLIDPYLQALQMAYQAQNQNISRYGQAGAVPIVLDPEVDYFSLVRGITGDRNTWVAQAVRATGLPPEVLQQVYDRGIAQGGIPSKEAFDRLLTTAAYSATPSLTNQQMQAQLTGYYGGSPTLEREQWQTNQTGMLNGQPTMTREQLLATLTGMYQGNPTFAREQYETGTGLNLLNMASNLRGPENYAQYANMLRGAQGSPALAYAQQLTTGKLAPQTQWGASQPATLQGLTGQSQASLPMPQIAAPNALHARSVYNMTPTESSMYNSTLQSQGYEPADYWEQFKRLAPRGTSIGTTTYR